MTCLWSALDSSLSAVWLLGLTETSRDPCSIWISSMFMQFGKLDHCKAKCWIVSQSDDSILCLITTFISPAVSSLGLHWNAFMKNLLQIICIFWFPRLASCLWMGEWRQRRSLLHVNAFHLCSTKSSFCLSWRLVLTAVSCSTREDEGKKKHLLTTYSMYNCKWITVSARMKKNISWILFCFFFVLFFFGQISTWSLLCSGVVVQAVPL